MFIRFLFLGFNSGRVWFYFSTIIEIVKILEENFQIWRGGIQSATIANIAH